MESLTFSHTGCSDDSTSAVNLTALVVMWSTVDSRWQDKDVPPFTCSLNFTFFLHFKFLGLAIWASSYKDKQLNFTLQNSPHGQHTLHRCIIKHLISSWIRSLIYTSEAQPPACKQDPAHEATSSNPLVSPEIWKFGQRSMARVLFLLDFLIFRAWTGCMLDHAGMWWGWRTESLHGWIWWSGVQDWAGEGPYLGPAYQIAPTDLPWSGSSL